MNFKSSRFNYHTSLNYRPHSNFHAPQRVNNPIDRSLEILRKIAEFKTLIEEISFMPSRESYKRFNGYSSDTNRTFDLVLQPKIEDLEVIGCIDLEVIVCSMERLVQIQHHREDKEKVIIDLYRNQLPEVMLNTVREWTENQTSLKAVNVSMPDDYDIITVSNLKGWLTRAIHEGVTHLTDDELTDFIGIVKDRTYANFRIQDDEPGQDSSKVFFVNIVAGH